MRTTTCITRLLGNLFLLAGLLSGSCISEQTEVENPVPPTTTEGERREVLFTLKNKLALTGSATRADGIATKEENAVATLDVYVFASATEGGTYTYQERFAYRGEGQGELPEGATSLPLAVDGADNESKTTGLLSLKKGLFVKFYCVANATTLTDPATGNAVEAAAYQPLKLDEAGTPGVVAQAGKPTETEFLTYHTPLLSATEPTDVLVTPLSMSGAYTTPLDLTDAESTSRLQVGFKLTRLAARFDVVNKASESRFTLQSISMGKGRRGSGFFPIAVCGAQPAANGELITYPEIAFAGDKANQGTQTGAFYSYPSPTADSGYLILKGIYKVNATDEKEVTYQVPFRQQTGNGGETYLEINHNHRYTIALSEADEYHLDADIRVADWTDDGKLEDYEPDNKPGEVTVTLPPAFVGDSEDTFDPARKIHTVSMSLKLGSSFEATVGASAPLQVSKTYAGGLAAQQYDWLEIAEPVPGLAASDYTYQFALKAGYNKRYPRVTVRFFDAISGSESILYVEAIAVPQPIETQQPAKAPNGTSDNPNTFELELQTASFFRITNSRADVKINCPDGVKVKTKPDWMDVTPVTVNGAETTYRLIVNDRDQATATGEVVFENMKREYLTTHIAVKLLDANIDMSYAGIGADNALEPAHDDVPANIKMPVKENNTITITTTSMDGVAVKMDFGAGNPAWLKHNAEVATRAGTTQKSIKFEMDNAKLAGAKKVAVTLVNKIGGKDVVFTIDPQLSLGILTKVSSVPTNDVLNTAAKTLTLYKLPSGESAMEVKVTSYGGSVLSTDNDNITVTRKTVTTRASDVTQDEIEAYYTLTAQQPGTTTLTLTNRSDATKTETYTVTVVDSRITGGDTSKELIVQNNENVTFEASSPLGFTAEISDYGQSSGGVRWTTALNKSDYVAGSTAVSISTPSSGTITNPNQAKNITVTLRNKILNGGDRTITVTPGIINIQLSTGNFTLENIINESTSKSFTINSPSKYTYSVISSNTGIISIGGSGTSRTADANKSSGSATITVKTASGASNPATFTVTVSRSYAGSGVYKSYNGDYYIAPSSVIQTAWTATLTNSYCAGKAGATWFVPTDADCRIMLGGISGDNMASSAVYNYYIGKNIFSVGPPYYWTASAASGSYAYYLAFLANGNVGVGPDGGKNTSNLVRCVSKK